MADEVYAKNGISHGAEDGTRYEYAPGDVVDRSLFSDEEWKVLAEGGDLTKKAPEAEGDTDETDELLSVGSEIDPSAPAPKATPAGTTE